MLNIDVTLKLDQNTYEWIMEGVKLTEQSIEAERGKYYHIRPDFFLRQAIEHEIERLKRENFN